MVRQSLQDRMMFDLLTGVSLKRPALLLVNVVSVGKRVLCRQRHVVDIVRANIVVIQSMKHHVPVVCTLRGIDASPTISVKCDLGNNIPNLLVVGTVNGRIVWGTPSHFLADVSIVGRRIGTIRKFDRLTNDAGERNLGISKEGTKELNNGLDRSRPILVVNDWVLSWS